MERRESVFGRIFKFALNLTLRQHRRGQTAQPRMGDRRSRRSAKRGAAAKKFWKDFTGLERLEARQMLSIAPADPNDALRATAALTPVALTSPALTSAALTSSALVAAANDPDTLAPSVVATADSANVQSAPTNPSENAQVDGSFRIEVRLVRSVGHGKGGHGGGHDDEPLAPSHSAGVGSGTAAPMVGYGSGGGGGPGSSGSAVLSVGTATAPEGGVLKVPITITGATESWGVSWWADPEDADTGVIYRGYIPDFGDGTRYISVPLQDDGPDNDTGDLPVEVEVSSEVGPGMVDVLSHISETAQAYTPTCPCGCGNVEASRLPSGRADVNTGQGALPEDLFYNGDDRPHPIVSVRDTLTNAPNDGSVAVQTTLYSLSDSSYTPVWTSTPVYYNPAGYTGGPVQFSTMIDGSGLADGIYEYATSVTEEPTDPTQPPIIRTYSNFVTIRNLDSSPYGDGWTLRNVDRLVPEGSGVAFEQGDGSSYYCTLDSADSTGNTYFAPANRPDIRSLVRNSDGSYTLTFQTGATEVFDSNGLLTAAVDQDGNQTTYQWNADSTLHSVTNQSGQTTTFAYTDGLLTSATDFAGRVTSYGYTGGQLTSISLPDPGHGEQQHVTTLGYDPTTGALTTITDAGGTTTLAYNDFSQVTSITNPDDTVTHYAAPSTQSLVDPASGLGTQSNPAPLVYLADVTGSTVDGNGHTSTYTVDPNTGSELSVTDGTGADTASYQYNDDAQITQITQPPLTPGGQPLVTTLHYDLSGDLIERDLPDGTKETWTIDPTWHEPTVYVDAAGRETDYGLDPSNGDVLTVTQVGQNGDANRVTTFTYTPNPTAQGQTPGGLVATMTDPRGIEDDYFYSSAGLVTSIVYAVGTPDQASVSMTYDQNDNPASYTNELNATTLFVFDNSNRKVQEQDPPPDPSQPDVRPTYTWSYDTRGNMDDEVNALQQETQFVYGPGSDGDEPDLDQMIQPDPAGGTNHTITTYGHDNADNLTSITDPMSRLETIGLDADNRQTSITFPNPVGGGAGGPTESVVLNTLGFPIEQFDLAGSETDNTFNWRGQVLTTTGPAPTPGAARPTVTFTYNGDGQVTSEQDALGHLMQLVYNSFGELIEEILPDPDGSGPLASPVLHWSYDSDGNEVGYIDADGNQYTDVYNNRNERTEEIEPSPDGVAPRPTWQWQYNTAQELTETVDPMGRVYQQEWNPDGWLVATIAPNLTTGGPGDATTTTTLGYDLDGNQVSTTTPNGGTTREILDDLNRVIETDQPVPGVGQSAPVWKYTLDADGEMTQELDPLGRTQVDTFDGMGRETNDVSFTGVDTATAYNNLSEVTTVTVGTGADAETTTNTWDALGRKTEIQDALSGTTQMAFDLDGFMTALTDSDSNTTTWVRDNLERVTSDKNQLGYSRLYSWDPASNLTQETDRDGRVRDLTVDHLNRTTAEKWIQGGNVVNTIATAYNADGEVTSAGDSFSNYAFGYDGQGHLASVDNAGTPGVPDVQLAGQFDGQGDRTSLSATIAGVKDFLNSYSYDTLSRLTSIEQQGQTGGNAVNPKTIDFAYDGVGDITSIDRMNSVGMGPNPQSDPADSTLSYNSLGQLTGITPSHNGVNIDPLSWTYDTLDRAATFTNDDGTATYGYDKTSQLTSVSYTGTGEPPNENYSFDPNGNQNEAGHVVSPANQVTNDGTFTYAFDNEGNRTSRTRISSDYATDHTVTYSWDYRDRLTDVEYFDNNNVLTKHVHYVYGVFDHLIETDVDPTGGGSYTIVTHNIYDLAKPVVTAEDATQPVEPGLMISAAGNVVLQTNGSHDVTERILNGPITNAADAYFTALAQDDVASGNTYWFLLNDQGSFMDAVDANGAPVDHAVYTGFGDLHSETNPAVQHITGFAGGLIDAYTGLVNFLHRWYDPLASVWLSVDPSGFLAADTNLARYVGNSPATQLDPSGLAPPFQLGRPRNRRWDWVFDPNYDSDPYLDAWERRMLNQCMLSGSNEPIRGGVPEKHNRPPRDGFADHSLHGIDAEVEGDTDPVEGNTGMRCIFLRDGKLLHGTRWGWGFDIDFGPGKELGGGSGDIELRW